eukprot:6908398-Pyramimonas_sp.AAC.2
MVNHTGSTSSPGSRVEPVETLNWNEGEGRLCRRPRNPPPGGGVTRGSRGAHEGVRRGSRANRPAREIDIRCAWTPLF